jgi:hypothetical protein
MDEENKEEIKNTRGMNIANKINLSLGITNFPSPNLEISQNNNERVVPIDKRNPLLASRVIGV